MPMYRFHCEDCGCEFDVRLKVNDSNLGVHCPEGHIHVRKVFTSPQIIYKGSGFYSIDHREAKK